MLLNSSVQYAITIINELKGKTEPVPAYKIVKKHNLSPSFTDRLARQMRNAGILKANRGQGGGYTLVKEDVSVLELIELLTEARENYVNQPDAIPVLLQMKKSLSSIHI